MTEPEPSEPTATEPEDEAGEREEEEADESPDALVDEIFGKVIKERVIIDRPRFSMASHGKIQMQYYGPDGDDPDNEEEFFLRRFRPFLLGHLGLERVWTWKFEAELGADISAGTVDLNQLDIRDVYVRYEGFEGGDRRLTLGNQKASFSRDFMTPSVRQLLVERSFVGDGSLGVPTRVLGAHYRRKARDGKRAYWGTLGVLGHEPGASQMKFSSPVGARSDLNEGLLVAVRLDFHPRGLMTFADGDDHTPKIKSTWSLAAYGWENDGRNNTLTRSGVSLDPQKADLDSAWGLEISGGVRGHGITLDWQLNKIHGETVAQGFTGGIYVDGSTDLDSAAVEGAYWIPGTPVELGGVVSRIDADGYAEPWRRLGVVLNLASLANIIGKVQIGHDWIFDRDGIPGEDFRETRVQIQYVW